MDEGKKTKQKVTFSYRAPQAQRVLLAGDFTEWQQAPLGMKKSKDGVWTKTATLPPGRYEYRLLVERQRQKRRARPRRKAKQRASA